MDDAKERVEKLFEIAVDIFGNIPNASNMLHKSRMYPFTYWRGIIIKRMCDDGYGVSETARALCINHSTVIYWRRKINDILKYKLRGDEEILKMYNEFNNRLIGDNANKDSYILISTSKLNKAFDNCLELGIISQAAIETIKKTISERV